MKCNEKKIPFVEFIEFIINYDIEILCNYYLENNLIKSTSLIDSNDQIHSNGKKKKFFSTFFFTMHGMSIPPSSESPIISCK